MSVKKKASISINKDVYDRLTRTGMLYGLKFSHMVERSARYYLAEFEDLEEALHRSKHEKEHLTLEETEKFIELED
ncbi:hypothetical protein ACFL4Q_02630 [candidate division KSB1 bacterium]